MPDGIIGRIKKIFVRDALNEWLKRIPGRICFMDVFHIVFPSECPKCPEAIKKIRKVLAEEYGGTTEWDGYGCWINPRGETECLLIAFLRLAKIILLYIFSIGGDISNHLREINKKGYLVSSIFRSSRVTSVTSTLELKQLLQNPLNPVA